MPPKNTLIVGASGHAKVCIDILEKQNLYTLKGLVDRQKTHGEFFCNYPILGSDENILPLIQIHNLTHCFIAVGDNWTRNQIQERILKVWPSVQFATLIHPTASIAKGAKIGSGTVLMPHTTVGPDTTIGNQCIINTHASVDHDGRIESFVSLAPHAGTGGNCVIKHHSFIGIGAHLKHGISIGEHTTVGSGSYVHTDLASHGVYYGSPAKRIRDRNVSDKSL